MVAAVAIDTAKGRILDEGPDAREDDEAFEQAKRGRISAQGIVKQAIHGPKGEIRGAVLEDGRIIRLRLHEAKRFLNLLTRGARISVKGDGATTSFGTVVEADEIGASADALKPVEAKKPKHGPAIKSRTAIKNMDRNVAPNISNQPFTPFGATPIFRYRPPLRY